MPYNSDLVVASPETGAAHSLRNNHSRGGKESGLAEQRDAAGAMMDDAAVSGGWGLMTR